MLGYKIDYLIIVLSFSLILTSMFSIYNFISSKLMKLDQLNKLFLKISMVVVCPKYKF